MMTLLMVLIHYIQLQHLLELQVVRNPSRYSAKTMTKGYRVPSWNQSSKI